MCIHVAVYEKCIAVYRKSGVCMVLLLLVSSDPHPMHTVYMHTCIASRTEAVHVAVCRSATVDWLLGGHRAAQS